MPDRVHHCPFLNRSDPRCSTHFSLDSLSEAFADCVGAYGECPTYRELLAERRTRRGEPVDVGWSAFPGARASARPYRPDSPAQPNGYPIVPLTLSIAADARRAAAVAGRPLA